MLTRAQEESAVNERISVEDFQGILAECAGYLRLVLTRQRRQDEESRVVVAMITLVFDL